MFRKEGRPRVFAELRIVGHVKGTTPAVPTFVTKFTSVFMFAVRLDPVIGIEAAIYRDTGFFLLYAIASRHPYVSGKKKAVTYLFRSEAK